MSGKLKSTTCIQSWKLKRTPQELKTNIDVSTYPASDGMNSVFEDGQMKLISLMLMSAVLVIQGCMSIPEINAKMRQLEVAWELENQN